MKQKQYDYENRQPIRTDAAAAAAVHKQSDKNSEKPEDKIRT